MVQRFAIQLTKKRTTSHASNLATISPLKSRQWTLATLQLEIIYSPVFIFLLVCRCSALQSNLKSCLKQGKRLRGIVLNGITGMQGESATARSGKDRCPVYKVSFLGS